MPVPWLRVSVSILIPVCPSFCSSRSDSSRKKKWQPCPTSSSLTKLRISRRLPCLRLTCPVKSPPAATPRSRKKSHHPRHSVRPLSVPLLPPPSALRHLPPHLPLPRNAPRPSVRPRRHPPRHRLQPSVRRHRGPHLRRSALLLR